MVFKINAKLHIGKFDYRDYLMTIFSSECIIWMDIAYNQVILPSISNWSYQIISFFSE